MKRNPIEDCRSTDRSHRTETLIPAAISTTVVATQTGTLVEQCEHPALFVMVGDD